MLDYRDPQRGTDGFLTDRQWSIFFYTGMIVGASGIILTLILG